MDRDEQWANADESAVSWLREVALDANPAGYGVGPMPDKAFILHPIFERVDGKSVTLWRRLPNGEEIYVEQPDESVAPRQRVRWDEYAERRGTPGFHLAARLDYNGPLAEAMIDDDHVWGPDEGDISDPETRRALFEILLRHTNGGADAICTAYWFDRGNIFNVFIANHHVEGLGPDLATPSNVMRGPLGSWRELFDRTDRDVSPQNLWPDTHQWVLQTPADDWATTISGDTKLIEEFIASPDLEVIRQPRPS